MSKQCILAECTAFFIKPFLPQLTVKTKKINLECKRYYKGK